MVTNGRPRKTSRMDAAFDAMMPFEFPKELVRSKMKQLLKRQNEWRQDQEEGSDPFETERMAPGSGRREYGGDVGYPFIEADSYRVLIEAICEDQESKQGEHSSKIFADGETSMKNVLMEDEMGGSQAALVTAGPSGENVEPEYSQTSNTTPHNNSRAKGDENSWKDIVLDQTTGSQDMIIVETADNIGVDYISPVGSPQRLLIAGSSATPTPARKRKPCYGWIGDGEDDDNFVVLTPAVAHV